MWPCFPSRIVRKKSFLRHPNQRPVIATEEVGTPAHPVVLNQLPSPAHENMVDLLPSDVIVRIPRPASRIFYAASRVVYAPT